MNIIFTFFMRYIALLYFIIPFYLFASPFRNEEVDKILGKNSKYLYCSLEKYQEPDVVPFFMKLEVQSVAFNHQPFIKETDSWKSSPLPQGESGPLPQIIFSDDYLLEEFHGFLWSKKPVKNLNFHIDGKSEKLSEVSLLKDEVDLISSIGLAESTSMNFSLSGTYTLRGGVYNPDDVLIRFQWSLASSDRALTGVRIQPVLRKGIVYDHQVTESTSGTKKLSVTLSLFLSSLESQSLALFPLTHTPLSMETPPEISIPPELVYYNPHSFSGYLKNVQMTTCKFAFPESWISLWNPERLFHLSNEEKTYWESLRKTYRYKPNIDLKRAFYPKKLPSSEFSSVNRLPEQDLLGPGFYKIHDSSPKDSFLGIDPQTQSPTLYAQQEQTWSLVDDGSSVPGLAIPIRVITYENTSIPFLPVDLSAEDPSLKEYVLIDVEEREKSESGNAPSPNASINTLNDAQASTEPISAPPPPASFFLTEVTMVDPSLIVTQELIRQQRQLNRFFLPLIADVVRLPVLTELTIHHVGLFQLSPQKLAQVADLLNQTSARKLHITQCFPGDKTNPDSLCYFLIRLLANSRFTFIDFSGNEMNSSVFKTFASLVTSSPTIQEVHCRLPDEETYLTPKIGAGLATLVPIIYTASAVFTGGASLPLMGIMLTGGGTAAAGTGYGATKFFQTLSHKGSTLIHKRFHTPNTWVLNCCEAFQLPSTTSLSTLVLSNNPEPATTLFTLQELTKKWPSLTIRLES